MQPKNIPGVFLYAILSSGTVWSLRGSCDEESVFQIKPLNTTVCPGETARFPAKAEDAVTITWALGGVLLRYFHPPGVTTRTYRLVNTLSIEPDSPKHIDNLKIRARMIRNIYTDDGQYSQPAYLFHKTPFEAHVNGLSIVPCRFAFSLNWQAFEDNSGLPAEQRFDRYKVKVTDINDNYKDAVYYVKDNSYLFAPSIDVLCHEFGFSVTVEFCPFNNASEIGNTSPVRVSELYSQLPVSSPGKVTDIRIDVHCRHFLISWQPEAVNAACVIGSNFPAEQQALPVWYNVNIEYSSNHTNESVSSNKIMARHFRFDLPENITAGSKLVFRVVAENCMGAGNSSDKAVVVTSKMIRDICRSEAQPGSQVTPEVMQSICHNAQAGLPGMAVRILVFALIPVLSSFLL